MDGMLVLGSIIGIAITVAILVTPFALSWPQRVRWTVAAQALGATDPVFAAHPPLDLREVVLTGVVTRGCGIELRVREAGHRDDDVITFVTTAAVDAALASMLREWSVLRTPMFLYVDTAGIACVSGPGGTVDELRRVAPAPLSTRETRETRDRRAS
jgi:hypothetical protein